RNEERGPCTRHRFPRIPSRVSDAPETLRLASRQFLVLAVAERVEEPGVDEGLEPGPIDVVARIALGGAEPLGILDVRETRADESISADRRSDRRASADRRPDRRASTDRRSDEGIP